MMISVHIPKTGGTTFREQVLAPHFGARLVLDYPATAAVDDRSGNIRGNWRKPPVMLGDDNLKKFLIVLGGLPAAMYRAMKYDCVHGHFLPVKYRFAGMGNRFVTWLRDPVERELSRYYHFKRKQERGEFGATGLPSLREFCELERYHNFYLKYLWKFDLALFAFVGITERYDDSMAIFTRMFGIPTSGSLAPENRNPDKADFRYEIDSNTRDLILDRNRSDCLLYRRALAMNDALRDRYL